MKRRNFISFCAAAAAAACTRRPLLAADTISALSLPPTPPVHVGGSKRIEIGGGHWVWTKKVGNGNIKVLLLHGGPGADHRYFEGFEDFLPLNLNRVLTTRPTGSGPTTKNKRSQPMDDPAVHRRSGSGSPGSQSGSVLSTWAFLGWPSGHRICFEIPAASKRAGDFQHGGQCRFLCQACNQTTLAVSCRCPR